MVKREQVIVVALVLIVLCAGWMLTNRHGAPAALTLWAWEGYEDMTFVQPHAVKLAFYAGTIHVTADQVFLRPRLNRVKFPDGATVIPVFRIESKLEGRTPSPEIVDLVVERIKNHVDKLSAGESGSAIRLEHAVQIDYDAPESQREFYLALLKGLRSGLPPGTRISITALASWCLRDRWLSRADADEAVVMLFSMGPARNEILRLLQREKLATGSRMDLSIGISANEKYTNERLKTLGVLGEGKGLYVFQSLPWTRSRFDHMKREVLQ